MYLCVYTSIPILIIHEKKITWGNHSDFSILIYRNEKVLFFHHICIRHICTGSRIRLYGLAEEVIFLESEGLYLVLLPLVCDLG